MSEKKIRGFKKESVKVLSEEEPYKGFLSVEKYHLQYERFEGGWTEPLSRELLRRKDAVAVVLHDPQESKVIMVEQFRVGALSDRDSPWLLEFVAGLIDSEESPEQIAARECMEEAGCHVDPERLELVQDFYLSPGACNENLYLYYAQIDSHGLGGIHGLDAEGEDIRVHVLDCERAFELMDKGEIRNAIGIIGLQWLRRKLDSEVGN